jgi:hypothetical protein
VAASIWPFTAGDGLLELLHANPEVRAAGAQRRFGLGQLGVEVLQPLHVLGHRRLELRAMQLEVGDPQLQLLEVAERHAAPAAERAA